MPSSRLQVPPIARDNRLAGKTGNVTGAGSAGELGGTGADIAILFAAKGANVVILDIDDARATHTKEACDGIAGQSLVHVADLTKATSCADAVSAAVAAFGT